VQNFGHGLDRCGRRRVYYTAHMPTFQKLGWAKVAFYPVLLNS
jgi:hypothetical protein